MSSKIIDMIQPMMMQLETARKHAKQGKVMDAHKASADVRAKYGIK